MHNETIIQWIRSDEGLTLETSAFQIFHGGNSTFINSFDKTKFLYYSMKLSSTFTVTDVNNYFSALPHKLINWWTKNF